MMRSDDLRRNYKARRLRQIEFIRENSGTDLESLAKSMIDQGIYSPKTTLEEAIRRVIWEREFPTQIGPKKSRKILSVEEIQAEIARIKRKTKRDPAELEILRKGSMKAIGIYLLACGWVKDSQGRDMEVNWTDPIDRRQYRADVAFMLANTRAIEFQRLKENQEPPESSE